MERQLLVAELVHLLDDRGTDDLFAGQARCTEVRVDALRNEVLQGEVGNHRLGIENEADRLELFGMLVGDSGRLEGELIFTVSARRGECPFGRIQGL